MAKIKLTEGQKVMALSAWYGTTPVQATYLGQSNMKLLHPSYYSRVLINNDEHTIHNSKLIISQTNKN